ncbi:hypothetical protein DID88_004406 [Monilinia fructigena]|uniref:Heterokaryon incompatibility domain-containing protein n=1 Tax=Monilinia fructigena TaxID=38457 RepID=A0A395IR63_9HELO|nr:hypothetical protein DID88_004406 [Monilinia fructigena]
MGTPIYRPLNNTIQEIRVLRILNGTTRRFDEPLACSFEYISLTDDPSFAALSYTWGDMFYDSGYSPGEVISNDTLGASPSVPISIDGVLVRIGENLLNALQYFRFEAAFKPIQWSSAKEPRFSSETRLWADALCINQEDLTERSQQVSKMHEIYRKASRILVWPGAPQLDGQRELAAFIDSFEEEPWNIAQMLLRPHNTRLLSALHDPGFDKCWEALEEIYKARYWNRLWIVQEVLSNSETWVYVGKELVQLLPLLTMGLALQYLEDCEIEILPSYTKSIVESVRIPPNLPLLDGKLHFSDPEAKPMELLELLQTFRKFECRDPRDKVYALAGLSSPHSKKLVIDYSKELSQEGTALRPGLLRGPTAYQLDRWNASGDTSANAHISGNGSVLKCKGVLLGTITHIVRPVTDYGPQDFHNILQLICNSTTQDIDSLNQGALFIALRETLLKTAYIDEPVSRDLPPPTFLKIRFVIT